MIVVLTDTAETDLEAIGSWPSEQIGEGVGRHSRSAPELLGVV